MSHEWKEVLTTFDTQWQICKCNSYAFPNIIEKIEII